ncbi:Ppx/GppA phosphatase family protein [Rhabdaerophilum calidifontis]|uniref:Ppx/GppA phosphatase family protein n=1 Tax=Rhabdaerophilum calidifontis TaxID=2604328 RepID=UPI001238F440|nr:Ppx/GppA phosphatase family protein [Rhabdaerophilum calidifontis]
MAEGDNQANPVPLAADGTATAPALDARPPSLPAAPCRPDSAAWRFARRYAALDLGTNNCRLLIARPEGPAFRVVDAFSRIVRLGEGVSQSGRLSEGAMARTLEALHVCRRKMDERMVSRARLVATEACRAAANGREFLARVERETGLRLDILDREGEAHLAAAGCAALADEAASSIILFDIGGGSTEIVWLSVKNCGQRDIRSRIRAWTSMPLGVVTLAERHGGITVCARTFEKMIAETAALLAPFAAEARAAASEPGFHLLGTSGTVTTLGGLFLGLERYDRRRVDGLWMEAGDVDAVIQELLAMSYRERQENGCIGRERADLVLAGCAIFEAIRRAFPARRVRIGDRGLREGMLMEMMREDGVLRRAAAR